jgi:hypothetical protein
VIHSKSYPSMLGAALISSLALVATSTAQSEQGESILLEVGTARLDKQQTIQDASFRIQGGKIQEVEDRASKDARSKLRGDRRYTFPSGYVTAGFVDVHSQLGASGELGEDVLAFFPQFDASAAYDPAYPGWQRLAWRGVTSLVLAPSDASLVGGLSAFLRPGQMQTPVANFMKLSLTDAMTQREREPTSLLGAIDLLERRYGAIEKPSLGTQPQRTAGEKRFAQTIGAASASASPARPPPRSCARSSWSRRISSRPSSSTWTRRTGCWTSSPSRASASCCGRCPSPASCARASCPRSWPSRASPSPSPAKARARPASPACRARSRCSSPAVWTRSSRWRA